MKVGMDWRGKKEVEGETEEAWEEVMKRRRSQTSKGKPYTLKETRGLKLGLVSHKPMAMLQGEVEVQMNVEMQKERGADQGQIKLEMEKGEGSSLGESQVQDRGEGSASGENQGGDRNAEGSKSNDDKYERERQGGGDIERGVQENNLEVIDFSGIPQAFLAIIGVITVST